MYHQKPRDAYGVAVVSTYSHLLFKHVFMYSASCTRGSPRDQAKQATQERAMSFTIGGIEMSLPIILAAGVAKHPSRVIPYLKQDTLIGAAISGSYTLPARDGNQGTLQWPADFGELERQGFGLNAWGMPNTGLREAQALFPQQTKPHIVSIAGFSADEYVTMLTDMKGNKRIAGGEINAGCPNTGHLPVAYVLADMEALLKKSREVHFDKPIWWKLSPYMTQKELAQFAREHPHLNFDGTPTVSEDHVERVCDLFSRYADVVSALVVSNTVPNVVYKTAISVRNADGSVHHKGGLSGPIVRSHNLKLVQRMVATGIAENVDIIGCGGVLTGNHALEYFDVGCKAVACASGPAWSDAKFFQHLLEGSTELQEYLAAKM